MTKTPKTVKADRIAQRLQKAALTLNGMAESLAEATFACQEGARELLRLAKEIEVDAR